MTAATPTVSVVIPTRGRRERLRRVVAPLLKDPATHEIVVIVDGGDDGTYQDLLVIARADSRVRPVLTRNRGQSAAQQHGALLASGEVALFLDDDVIPGPALVSGHAQHHRDAGDLVTIGHMPVMLPQRTTAADWIVLRYAGRYDRMVEKWERDPERILLGLWGGNVSIRRCHLADVPLDAKQLDLRYHVDWEFGLRCRRAGLRAVFDRRLCAHHEYSRSVDQFMCDRARSAADRVQIHRVHAAVLGPLSESYFRSDAPLPARVALRCLSHHGARRAEQLLQGVIAAATRTRRYRVQAHACDVLDRLRGQRIAKEAQTQVGLG